MSLWKIWRPIRQFQRYDDEQYCPTPDPSAKPDLPPNGESIEKAEQGDPYLVSFDDTPHLSARNWDVWYKVRVVAQLVLITIQVTMASAISSSAVDGQVQEFAIAQEVSELSTAVFLAGFACGAVPFAPLSEAVGRQVVYVVTLLISSLFEFGAAAATNVQTLIICRAFAGELGSLLQAIESSLSQATGFFGATPLSNAGGSLNDLFDPAHRSYACAVVFWLYSVSCSLTFVYYVASQCSPLLAFLGQVSLNRDLMGRLTGLTYSGSCKMVPLSLADILP